MHSDQPRCRASGHASRLQACWKRAEHVTADDRLSSSMCARDECVSSFWIVETMRCNRVLASSTCQRQPIRLYSVQTRGSARTAAPPGDRADRKSAVGPAGHVDQRRSPRLRIYKATHHVTATRRCADTITQHKRCDLSTHAGGASYSVTGKTARVTGITVRATCRAVLPSKCLVPLPPLLRKKLGRRSVAAVVRTGRGLPVVTRNSCGGSCRARRSLVGRAATQSSAASEQARQTS